MPLNLEAPSFVSTRIGTGDRSLHDEVDRPVAPRRGERHCRCGIRPHHRELDNRVSDTRAGDHRTARDRGPPRLHSLPAHPSPAAVGCVARPVGHPDRAHRAERSGHSGRRYRSSSDTAGGRAAELRVELAGQDQIIGRRQNDVGSPRTRLGHAQGSARRDHEGWTEIHRCSEALAGRGSSA